VAGTIVLVVSDTHIGGTTALSLLKFVTDEGQEIKATAAQEWLHANWLDLIEYTKQRAGIVGKELTRRGFTRDRSAIGVIYKGLGLVAPADSSDGG